MIKLFTKKRKGFTLIELVVVIAILGILAALAIPRFIGSLDNAKQRTHDANIRTIESAIAVYAAENGLEPTEVNDIDDLIPEFLKENPTNPWDDSDTEAYSVSGGAVSGPSAP